VDGHVPLPDQALKSAVLEWQVSSGRMNVPCQGGRQRTMSEHTFTPGPTPITVRAADGRVLTAPEGWVLLPPGDAALTRRVKAAGDHWAAVEAGGRVLGSKCDGSTFLIRYESAVRGRHATGSISGWIGLEDPNSHKPPLTEPYYCVISVDVREETARRW
jgi:hypothetical protein